MAAPMGDGASASARATRCSYRPSGPCNTELHRPTQNLLWVAKLVVTRSGGTNCRSVLIHGHGDDLGRGGRFVGVHPLFVGEHHNNEQDQWKRAL